MYRVSYVFASTVKTTSTKAAKLIKELEENFIISYAFYMKMWVGDLLIRKLFRELLNQILQFSRFTFLKSLFRE